MYTVESLLPHLNKSFYVISFHQLMCPSKEIDMIMSFFAPSQLSMALAMCLPWYGYEISSKVYNHQ